MNGMFYRGEVYYVYPTGNEIGSEQHAGRPAIIVSNSQNNKNSSTLEIVYLTTREKRPMQTHVHINAAGKLQESTALCEQIFTVDKLRLNDYIGQLCDKEMQDIEFGLMVSLGLDNYLSKPKPVEAPGVAAAPVPVASPSVSDTKEELEKLRVQRDTYKDLLMEVIGRK
ncbi:type II toxin-antitoxin system PemK/MazF family toxin [Faecalibacterium sp. 9]|jgi:mRNA interferase MazF|uniref:type II toxin-antitoxin system PemK/MazF family toxin n=1 Tax=unclassified Faecalibacterium TaxID=2646395 RepID=UPI003AAF25D7